MLYLLDSANLEEIENAYTFFPMAGVTTNPTLIAKEKRDFFALLRDIRACIGQAAMLHAQVLGDSAEEMLLDAQALQDNVGGNLFIKVPVTAHGYRAMKLLKQKGFQLTATAIFTPAQALLAATCGADYTAPYVNRIDTISGNGVSVVATMAQLFEQNTVATKILAASFKNVQQIHEVTLAGSQAVTLPADLLWKLSEHPLTESGVQGFKTDWQSLYGTGKCVHNL